MNGKGAIYRLAVCDRFTYNTMFGEDYSIMIAGALSYPFGSKDRADMCTAIRLRLTAISLLLMPILAT